VQEGVARACCTEVVQSTPSLSTSFACRMRFAACTGSFAGWPSTASSVSPTYSRPDLAASPCGSSPATSTPCALRDGSSEMPNGPALRGTISSRSSTSNDSAGFGFATLASGSGRSRFWFAGRLRGLRPRLAAPPLAASISA